MSKKASDLVKYYYNENGPVIGTVHKGVLCQDGLYCKDIDGSGVMKDYNDWRLPPKQRAESYVKQLSVKEKIGQLFIADWRMGIYQKDESKRDESGLLDEAPVVKGENIFARQDLPGTTDAINNWFVRHFIFRQNPTPEEHTDWINQLQASAEKCDHLVPVIITSNSRNEHGEMVFGMNDSADVFTEWPGTLGIAAAIKGDDIGIINRFAHTVRKQWDAVGMKKGYIYMADVMSDPRWQRTYGTFGEDPELIAEIFSRMVPIIQGGDNGVTPEGIAMTVKHFPGGGTRENGFDPHYKMGQWNVYQTEGSLQKYHLPAFQKAVDKKVASIMPYYAKPAMEKSDVQKDYNGDVMEMQPYGFAFNKPFIDGLLRNQMGFKGYVNSDSGITGNMCWGVELLDVPERVGFAINHAGVDIISGAFNIDEAFEAYARGKNDYYDTHPVPAGFSREDIVLTDEVLDRAVARTLEEQFALGVFENPYRDAKKASQIIGDEADKAEAALVHRKSVTLLKNDGTLPLTADKLIGKKVYAATYFKNGDQAPVETEKLKALLKDKVELTEDYTEADYALLFLNPSSGDYFSATKGYLELEICENKTVCDIDDDGKPIETTHTETTLTGMNEISEISKAVHQNGGKIISNINVTLAWQVGSVEKLSDCLLAGYSTFMDATLDVIFGNFVPTGKLPITLPKDDSVIAVNKDGVCISPNDVPGYDKDMYMPDEMKDENGKAYAYRDSMGNYYEMNFGLSY